MGDGVITCGGCQAKIPWASSGQPKDSAFEAMGFRKMGNTWYCLVCTGLLDNMLKGNPALKDFLSTAAEDLDG